MSRSHDDDESVSFLPIYDKKNNLSPIHKKLAYHYLEGSESPTILFCSGFRSRMNGTKSLAIQEFCQQYNLPFCRFDYRGHGSSSGDFEACTLSDWIQDTSDILQHVVLARESKHKAGPGKNTTRGVILVGSSMGAWISFHLAMKYPSVVKGIVGIASAPDFPRNTIPVRIRYRGDWCKTVDNGICCWIQFPFPNLA